MADPFDLKSCPACKAGEIYVASVVAGGAHGANLLPGLSKGWFSAPMLELRACARCGWVQFFLPPAERQLLTNSKHWKRA